MTDGVQTMKENALKSVDQILTEASKPLRDKQVNIISLGIGKRVNKLSLKTIATGDSVYYAKSFKELRPLVKQLRKGSCIGKRMRYRNCYKSVLSNVP